MTHARLYVGPSGWHYEDWHGVVYPQTRSARFDALAFMARCFNALEVNSSFYRPPTARMTAGWVRRVPPAPQFSFAVKCWQRFTHQRTEPYSTADVETFLEGVRPLSDSGHAGCLLLQFPWSFRNTPDAWELLTRLADDFRDHRPVVEVRHASWDSPEARENLRGLGLSYCNIDQPRLNQCISPSSHVTGPVGYVRFHGRRADTWFASPAGRLNANVESHARYDYLYSEAELTEWIDRIRGVAGQTESTYVFTNNHYRGQGPANALQLRAMLERGKVSVPPDMLRHFPFLADIALPERHPRPTQAELF